MRAMTRYIAFLRAINVGGHNVKMEELRKDFEALGFSNVETFIASGNVIFDAPDKSDRALERRIEEQLKEALGYAVATFIRSVEEVKEIADYEPFPVAEHAKEREVLYIAFVPEPLTEAAQQRLLALRTQVDDFQAHGREIYWLCRVRSSDSTISGALLEKTIGMPATMRNSTTVRKLAAKYAPELNQ